jgi:hypothetical protein
MICARTTGIETHKFRLALPVHSLSLSTAEKLRKLRCPGSSSGKTITKMALNKFFTRQCGAGSIPSTFLLSPRSESTTKDLHFRLAGLHHASFYSAKPRYADLSIFR